MENNNNLKRFIKLAQPALPEAALQRAMAVLRSGALVQGQGEQELENALTAYLGAAHAVVASSGTAALHLALLASGIGPGDEVILPAFTFPATANAVVLTGARPVLVDVGLGDCNISPDLILRAVTPRTRAVIPVHEFGLPAAMADIRRIASQKKLLIIEDAACALGAEHDGDRIGAGVNLACFSFHPRKAITTGEGGVIVTNDARTAQRLRSLRNHGIVPGYNYRLTDFQAALALEQLKTLEEQIGYRQALAGAYGNALQDIEGVQLPGKYRERRHVYQTYHVMLDAGIDRDSLIHKLRDRCVETNFGAWALNLLTLYQREYGYTEDSCPNAVKAFRSGLALPMGGHVAVEDARWIAETLSECLSEISAAV